MKDLNEKLLLIDCQLINFRRKIEQIENNIPPEKYPKNNEVQINRIKNEIHKKLNERFTTLENIVLQANKEMQRTSSELQYSQLNEK